MRQELPSPGAGALVRVRGDCWRVLDLTRHDDCSVCRLAGARASNRGARRTLLLPFDRLVPAGRPSALSRVSPHGWMTALGARLADLVVPSGLRAAVRGRFDLLSYQLEPALAVLRGATRLLIADEVGLGKTVQAGLILAELAARAEATRILVLAPAGLCAQWAAELADRFHLDATPVDAAVLRRLTSGAAPGAAPWAHVPLAVSSFDFLKQPEVLTSVGALTWDALVVDEAHLVALAPERSRLVRLLASRARRVLLLTATPHAADAAGFRALCDTGRLPGERPIVLFRRTRASLGIRRTRRILVLRVRMSPAERAMHGALRRYTRTVWRDATSADARLAMIVLRKRAASGPASLEASLSRRLHWLASSPESPCPAGWQLPLPLDEESEDGADQEPARVLAAPGLRDAGAERRVVQQLLDLARAASPADSKLRLLCRLLRRTAEPALVFTEYRDTLTRLADHLRPVASLALLHGGLDPADRRSAVAEFTSGRARLLLATDAAAHGLNLQPRCRLVIDVDLPWTPARLEQRIGRVDRIGQARRVHAVHLLARRTAEEAVFARLASRVGRERLDLGEADNPLGAAGEMEMARVVFDEAGASRAPVGTATAPADWSCTRSDELQAAAEEERQRVEGCRRLASRVAVARRLGPAVPGQWTVLRRRGALACLPLGLVCLFVSRVVDGRGSLVEEWPTVLHVALDPAVLPRATLTAVLPRLIASCRPQLECRVLALAHAHLARLGETTSERLAPLALREASLVPPTEDAGPVQAGLFDRRAVKRAEEAHRHRSAHAAEAAAHLAALARAGMLELAGAPELVSVLGVCL